MLSYYINDIDRSGDVSMNSLNINTAIQRRSNSARFEIFKGTKPTENQDVKIYHSAVVDSHSGTTIVLKPSFQTNYNVFRAGQVIWLSIGNNDMEKAVVDNFDEETLTVELTETPDVSLSENDLMGELIFGGLISRVTDSALYSLENVVNDITVVGYEKIFDKKLVADSWANVDARYIINSFVNGAVNYNATLDDLSYVDNTAIQAEFSEGGNGNNPTVDTAEYIEGTSSASLSWSGMGTATWESSPTTKNVGQLVGTLSGTPTKGFVMLWLKSADLTSVTSISVRVGSDNSNYALVSFDFDPLNTDWQYVKADLDTASITGTPNWEAVDYAQIRIITINNGAVLFNGLRINAQNSFTLHNVNPTLEFADFRAPQIKPTQLMQQLAKALEFTWYIDFERDVHFVDRTIQSCFYSITENSENFNNLVTEVDASQVGNRIIIEGGERQSTSFYKQVVRGDDHAREWLLKNKFAELTIFLDNNSSTDTMEASTNTTTVNATGHGLATGDYIVNRTRDDAVRQVTVVNANQFTVEAVPSQTNGDTFSKFATAVDVGVEGLDDEADFDYVANSNEKSVRASLQTTTLTQNDFLLFVYKERVQIRFQYTDSASANALKALGIGDGVFDLDKVTDRNITDTTTALSLAQAKVNEFANPVISGSLQTNYNGFKVGDVLNVVDTNRNISGDFVIQKISAKQRHGFYKDFFEYNVEFGTTLFGVIEFYQKLLAQDDGIEGATDDIVEVYQVADEIVEFSDSNSTTPTNLASDADIVEFSDTNNVYEFTDDWQYEPSTGQPVPTRYNLASYG